MAKTIIFFNLMDVFCQKFNEYMDTLKVFSKIWFEYLKKFTN